MNVADAVHESYEAYKRQMDIFHAKGHDYAGNDDTLANGKAVARAAAALGVARLIDKGEPDGVYLFMALWKIQRWCNLRLRAVTPRCETMADTTDDTANYVRLAALAQKEASE